MGEIGCLMELSVTEIPVSDMVLQEFSCMHVQPVDTRHSFSLPLSIMSQGKFSALNTLLPSAQFYTNGLTCPCVSRYEVISDHKQIGVEKHKHV